MQALCDSDPQRLGALMTEAKGFFDRYATPACPEELTSPVLHRVLEYEPLKPHILGGKGVGSQGDGTAQFICRTEADQQAVIQILERDLHLLALKLTITPQQKVRKAVIPAAGYGTRLFPASKATKKELFPIIDRDGIAKPAILIIVEEALEAGIEEVIIVVQKNDLEEFRFLFNEQISIENYNKLPPQFQEYSRRLLGDRTACHLCCSERTGRLWSRRLLHPRSRGRRTIPADARRPYLQVGQCDALCSSITGCIPAHRPKPGGHTPHPRAPDWQLRRRYRRLAGRSQPAQCQRVFAEKPTPDYARTNLRVPGLPEGEYLTLFGQYIIKPKLFDYLKEHIENNVREHGEFQLTSTLDRLRQEDGFLGLVMDGTRFDIGRPDEYLETLSAFRQ